jgi:hypothetical protein
MREPSSPPGGDATTVTPDGERLRYRVDGAGPPLLILNGLISSSSHWPFFVEHRA